MVTIYKEQDIWPFVQQKVLFVNLDKFIAYTSLAVIVLFNLFTFSLAAYLHANPIFDQYTIATIIAIVASIYIARNNKDRLLLELAILSGFINVTFLLLRITHCYLACAI